jgi:hypothetical protein
MMRRAGIPRYGHHSDPCPPSRRLARQEAERVWPVHSKLNNLGLDDPPIFNRMAFNPYRMIRYPHSLLPRDAPVYKLPQRRRSIVPRFLDGGLSSHCSPRLELGRATRPQRVLVPAPRCRAEMDTGRRSVRRQPRGDVLVAPRLHCRAPLARPLPPRAEAPCRSSSACRRCTSISARCPASRSCRRLRSRQALIRARGSRAVIDFGR